MEKLLNSYKTLLNLTTQLRLLSAVCDTIKDDSLELNSIPVKNFFQLVSFGKSVNAIVINYGLIIACSILDEYNKEFTVSEHNDLKDRVLYLKCMTKPIFQRIKRWPDLKIYRNQMLAHNFRLKDGKSFFSVDISNVTYRIPNSYSEFKLLTELLSALVGCVGDHFPDLNRQINMRELMIDRIDLPVKLVNVDEEISLLRQEISNLRRP